MKKVDINKEILNFKGILFHMGKDINKLLEKIQFLNKVIDIGKKNFTNEEYEYYKEQFRIIENYLIQILSNLSIIHNKINNL